MNHMGSGQAKCLKFNHLHPKYSRFHPLYCHFYLQNGQYRFQALPLVGTIGDRPRLNLIQTLVAYRQSHTVQLCSVLIPLDVSMQKSWSIPYSFSRPPGSQIKDIDIFQVVHYCFVMRGRSFCHETVPHGSKALASP